MIKFVVKTILAIWRNFTVFFQIRRVVIISGTSPLDEWLSNKPDVDRG